MKNYVLVLEDIFFIFFVAMEVHDWICGNNLSISNRLFEELKRLLPKDTLNFIESPHIETSKERFRQALMWHTLRWYSINNRADKREVSTLIVLDNPNASSTEFILSEGKLKS